MMIFTFQGVVIKKITVTCLPELNALIYQPLLVICDTVRTHKYFQLFAVQVR